MIILERKRLMKKRLLILFIASIFAISLVFGIDVKADEQAESEVLETSEVAAQSITNTGWYQEGGVWFYRGADGNLCRGWQTIGGKKYYFDPTHAYMYSDGWQYIQEESKKYYFTANGDLYTGWLEDSEFGWYYIKEGLYHDGWIQIGTVWYYIDNGRMIHDQYTYCVDGKYYGFKSNGAMLTGWNKVVYTLSDGTTDTDWYYYNTNGAAPNG